MFYLLGNCKKDGCYCSHDYEISDDDMLRMRKATKNRPCDSIKYGKLAGQVQSSMTNKPH